MRGAQVDHTPVKASLVKAGYPASDAQLAPPAEPAVPKEDHGHQSATTSMVGVGLEPSTVSDGLHQPQLGQASSTVASHIQSPGSEPTPDLGVSRTPH